MAKPMRVAQVMGKLMSGGVESVVYNYYRHMDHSRIQFDFFYDADSRAKPPDDIANMGGRFVEVPPYQNALGFVSALKARFEAENYAVVHAHLNALCVFPLAAAYMAKVPVRIAHGHSAAGSGEMGRNIVKRALKPLSKTFATHRFACSDYAGRWLFGDSDGVKIVHNAIDTEKFRYDRNAGRLLRQELGLGERFVIGHVGRFARQKNHGFLIDIFAKICERAPNAALLLIGDGELRSEIQSKVNALSLQKSVYFLGIRQDMSELYSAMDALLLPSLYEGLPVVAVEAQAGGLPVIMSTAITREAVLSRNVKRLNLSEGASAWAEAALCFRDAGRSAAQLSQSMDIKAQAGGLARFYSSLGEAYGF